MNKFEPTPSDYDSMVAYNSLFPINHLPKLLQEIVLETHTKLGYPIDYVASAIIAAVSGAIGNQARLEVKEGWRESAVLYMVLVGQAGANKSHPMEFAMRPLLKCDVVEMERYKSDKRDFDKKIISELTPPIRRVVSDTTIEGLSALHENNPNGLMLYADELKSWISNFDRYSSGSQEQFWLSNFSSKPIIVDRRDVANSISVEHPFISVLGSTQPRVLTSFAKGEKAFNGFFDRLLFAIIESADKGYWHTEDIDPAIERRYHSFINEILALSKTLESYNDSAPLIVRFSAEAIAEVIEWQRYNTDLVNDSGDELKRGVQTKLENYMLRLTLIAHIIRYYSTSDVSDIAIVDIDSVRLAHRLVEYYRVQAMLAIKVIRQSDDKPLTHKESAFLDRLPTQFSRGEILSCATTVGISQSSAYRIIDKYCGSLVAKDGHNAYRKVL